MSPASQSLSIHTEAAARVVRVSPTREQRTVEELGVMPHRPPRYAEMSNVVNRFGTFYDVYKWPSALKQKPNELADAGFFYTGNFFYI